MIRERVTAVEVRLPAWLKRGLAWETPAAAFLALLLLFFHRMAFSNLILARGDTFLYFYPYWQAAAEALRQGRVPLWNDALFMGAPMLANSQIGFFYPLNWPVWLLWETPYAVSVSILLHLALAGLGAYLAGRRMMGLSRWAALVTAVLFALGGYVTAQVEHINQLQGLAWLPWYLVLLGWGAGSQRARWVTIGGSAAAFAFLLAMQLLAGHAQTTFISGGVLLLWCAGEAGSWWYGRRSETGLLFSFRRRRFWRAVLPGLAAGGLLALLLTAVQLLPTLELAQYSSRRGGLPPNEVLSFSLHPLLLARSLLPVVGQSLFSEYVAFAPLTAVILALVGGWQWRRWPGVLPALLLVGVGLFLALGVFNPANWLLARLPGFNLFRVPARWLAMYSLGLALLAGVGFQAALDRFAQRSHRWTEIPERARDNLVHIGRPLRAALYLLVGLMLWNGLAGLLAFLLPTGPEAPFEAVRPVTLLLWLLEIGLAAWLLTGERPGVDRPGRWRVTVRRTRLRSPVWLLGVMVLVMFLASRSLPYHNLTTPEAYFDLRPPAARLQSAACRAATAAGGCLPERFLSLSNIFFDVGDQAEIDAIYAGQLSPAARYDYTVAIKHKEVIGPNLALTYGLASVDGFDGGILPLQAYSQLMGLILPPGVETTDGRLREHLTAVPPAPWLDLFGARYLITDKTGDAWRQRAAAPESVFFDLAHPLALAPGETFEIAAWPPFTSTAVLLLASGEPGQVLLTVNGETAALTPEVEEGGGLRVSWPSVLVPSPENTEQMMAAPTLALQAAEAGWRVQAATLINEAAGTFMPLTLGNYRLVHSGDVKIYENLDVLPRAFLVSDWQWVPDVAASMATMAGPAFDPRSTAVLVQAEAAPGPVPGGEAGQGQIEVLHYEPGRIALEVNTGAPRFLLLTEAYYPGWQATVDGEETAVFRADGYFQGIFLPAGEHEVVFAFESRPYAHGRFLSLVGWGIWGLLVWVAGVGYGRGGQKNVYALSRPACLARLMASARSTTCSLCKIVEI